MPIMAFGKMTYAHILNADNSIIKTAKYDNFDAAAVAHKFGADKEVRIVPVEKLADPTIANPLTERYGAINTVVEPTRVTKQRTVVAIPQEEQDAATELTAIKAVALDLKNGVGTAAERIARCERVLFRMLKDQYGS